MINSFRNDIWMRHVIADNKYGEINVEEKEIHLTNKSVLKHIIVWLLLLKI